MVGVQLAIMGWLWRVFRWIADIAGFAMRTPAGGDDSATSSLLSDVLVISHRLVDQISIYIVPVALIFVAIGVFRSKKIREGGAEVIKVLLFTALAALMVNTSVMWTVLRFSENVLDNAAGISVNLVENEITKNGGLGGVSLDSTLQDPLGCSAYTEELLERAKTGNATEPPPVTLPNQVTGVIAIPRGESVPATGIHRIVNAWAMWSYFPFWEYSSYGRNAGMTSRRMSCRELELRAGISAENQMGITSCAAASVLLEADVPADVEGKCKTGYTALNLNPDTDLGPFRDRPVMTTEHIRTRQATAWALCVSPPLSTTTKSSAYKFNFANSSNTKHLPTLFNTADDVYVPTIFAEGGNKTQTWGIHPGFYTRYAYVPTVAGGIRRAKHYGEALSSSVCREWWQGAKIDLPGLSTCPAWSQRTCNSLGDEFKFAVPSFTDLSLGENILDIVPRNFVWWNGSQGQITDDALLATLEARNRDGIYSETYTDNDDARLTQAFRRTTIGNVTLDVGGTADIEPIVKEADAWINVRSTGAPGFAEGIAALIAIIASFAYLPIMLGAVGGLALANIAVALLVGSSPVWILACVFKKARVFAVSMGKYLFAALSAKLIVFMVLVLYTFMFSIISSWGSALGYSAGHIVLLMWAGAVPLICMLLLNWVSKHQAWKSTDGYSPMSFAGMMKIGGASDVRKREVGRYTTRAKRIAGKATGKLSVSPSSLLDKAYNKASRHPETAKSKSSTPASLVLPDSGKAKLRTKPKSDDSKTGTKQEDIWDDDIKIVQEMRQSKHEQLLRKAEKTGDVSVDDIHKSGVRYYRSVYAAAALVAMKQGAKVSSSVLKQILAAASIKPKTEKSSDSKSKDKRKAKPQQKETKSVRADMLARNKAHREFKEDADKLLKAAEDNDMKAVEASAIEILKRESAARRKDKRAEAKHLKEKLGTENKSDTGYLDSNKETSYDDSDELPIWEHPSRKKPQKGLGSGFTTEIGKKGKQKIAIPVSSEESDTLLETDEDAKVKEKAKKLSDSAKDALRENKAFTNMRDYRKALKSARKEGDVKGKAFKAGHKYYISVAASAAQMAVSATTDQEISEIRDMLKRISPRKTRKPSNEMVIRKHFHSKNKLLLHKMDRALAAKNPKMIKEASEKLYKQMQQKSKQSPRVPKDYLL